MRNNNIRYILVIAVLAITPIISAYAQEPATASEAPATPAKLPDKLLRDPFWPIGKQPEGWGQKKGEKKELEGFKQWSLAAKKIKLSGISKDPQGNYFAVIRGQGVVEKGDVISVDYAGLTYSWIIKDVTKKGIVPAKLNVVPAK